MHMNSPSLLTILDIYTMKLSLPISPNEYGVLSCT